MRSYEMKTAEDEDYVFYLVTSYVRLKQPYKFKQSNWLTFSVSFINGEIVCETQSCSIKKA